MTRCKIVPKICTIKRKLPPSAYALTEFDILNAKLHRKLNIKNKVYLTKMDISKKLRNIRKFCRAQPNVMSTANSSIKVEKQPIENYNYTSYGNRFKYEEAAKKPIIPNIALHVEDIKPEVMEPKAKVSLHCQQNIILPNNRLATTKPLNTNRMYPKRSQQRKKKLSQKMKKVLPKKIKKEIKQKIKKTMPQKTKKGVAQKLKKEMPQKTNKGLSKKMKGVSKKTQTGLPRNVKMHFSLGKGTKMLAGSNGKMLYCALAIPLDLLKLK